MLTAEKQILIREKYQRLQQILSGMESVLVAFSGGVDSVILLDAACKVLGDRAAAATAFSPARPEEEIFRAKKFCREKGVRHIVLPSAELDIPEVARNDARRCYYCKKYLFKRLLDIAVKENFFCVAEGSNCDDEKQYRPGMQAVRELGVNSPLMEAGLTKSEIRTILKMNQNPAWNLASQSCLLTRFPYGQKVTVELLRRTQEAENYLKEKEFSQVRVRTFQDNVSIEVEKSQVPFLCRPDMFAAVQEKLRQLGFQKISVDPLGYRTGRMDEVEEKDGQKQIAEIA